MNPVAHHLTRFLAVILLLTVGGLGTAVAQDKGKGAAAKTPAVKKGEPVVKVLFDNDKARAYEATFKPGDVSPNRARITRAVRYLNTGKFQRVYPDGKTEDRGFKAGDVVWITPDTYAVKNVGKTKVTVYVVEVKSK
jgi:hypothetical protein